MAIFSEPVNDTLVDSSSFAVTDGVNPVVGTFSYSVDKAAYANALATGLFLNTYADDTVYEYWA